MNETDKNSDKKEKIGDATLVSDDQNIDTEIEEDTNEEQIIKVNENCYEIFYKKAEDELEIFIGKERKNDSKNYSKNKGNDLECS